MTLLEKRMVAVNVELKPAETLVPYDPVILEDRGGLKHIRKADVTIESPHAVLNSDARLSEDGTHVHVQSWWYNALIARYNHEHLKG
jgi:prolyl oligopeptidase PreP (S9A serine peptidase family)